MSYCQERCIQGIEEEFNQNLAKKQLEKYQKKGPAKTTQILVNYLRSKGIRDYTLIDIGGGVGAIQHELLKEGIEHVYSVDASSAYIEASKQEATRKGYLDRIDYIYGNFVDLAPKIPNADIVTLERVICCYPDMRDLVQSSISRTNKFYGVVYPRNTWWMRYGLKFVNVFSRLKRSDFRAFLHPKEEIHEIIDKNGFDWCFTKKSGVWVVEIFKRRSELDYS